jgi:uncharacterized membrane protein YhhN
MSRYRRLATWAVAIVWITYLVALVMGAEPPAKTILKALLMPIWLVWVLVHADGKAPKLLVWGLVFATIGDVGLDIEGMFVAGILAGFLVMQILYIIGFIQLARNEPGRTWIVPGLIYGIAWAGLVVVLGPRLGDLAFPIAFYGFFLCLTAVAAIRTRSRPIAIGATVFLISDAMIGMGLADLDFPGRGLAVMLTYLGAQFLISTGWLALAAKQEAEKAQSTAALGVAR